MALQQEQHAPNVIPSQFQTFQTAAATPVLAALTTTNLTAAVDGTVTYYGSATLKLSGITNPGTLRFTGTPIPIVPGGKWFCSFQIIAPSGATGSLAVKTSSGTTVTETFTVASSASAQQVWGLFDLTANSDPQATWILTFTSTSNVNLDGFQMNAVDKKVISFLPRFAGTQMVAGTAAYANNLDGVPDGSTYQRPLATALNAGQVDLSKAGVISKTLANVADDSGSSRFAVLAVDSNRRPLVDFTQAGHLSKNLDNIGDGSTYARYKAAGLTSGLADPSKSGITANGSVPPIILGCGFSWTTTSGQIVITWSAFTIYRPDGTTTSISAGAGTTVTGLTNGTVYTIYPYIVDGQTTVSFATGKTGSAGSPAICYAGGSGPAAQAAYAFANIPLQSFTATPSAGGGGGGGDQLGCPHEDSEVETANRGVVRAGELSAGDYLHIPTGAAAILSVERRPRSRWVMVKLSGAVTYETTVTPEHVFYASGCMVRAQELKLGALVTAEGGVAEVRSLELLSDAADSIVLALPEPHLYFERRGGAMAHNGNPKP